MEENTPKEFDQWKKEIGDGCQRMLTAISLSRLRARAIHRGACFFRGDSGSRWTGRRRGWRLVETQVVHIDRKARPKSEMSSPSHYRLLMSRSQYIFFFFVFFGSDFYHIVQGVTEMQLLRLSCRCVFLIVLLSRSPQYAPRFLLTFLLWCIIRRHVR